MAGLGETMARLARARKTQTPRTEGADDPRLREITRFGPNPGDLKMLAYAPEGLPAGAPLVVVLHGCTQRATHNARAAGWLTLAERHGFALLAPEQTGRNNPSLCFNWFQPADARRGVGELASIHAMTEHMVRLHALDADRVFVTGLSAGGAMTSALLAAYPETYAGGAVIAGLAVGAANNLHEALTAMRAAPAHTPDDLAAMVRDAAPLTGRKPRLAIWHGDADGTVAVSNARALASQWSAFHGLAQEPDSVQSKGCWTRSVWKDAEGHALVELNMLAGLSHGTPIAARGDDPLGEAAPFVLETGVSSSLEIARFWRLAPGSAEFDADARRFAAHASAQAKGGASSLGEKVMDQVLPHVPGDIGRVIGKALAAAGLMRR